MALLDPLFGSSRIGEIFSDASRVQGMLDFEAALARAEASVGLIPADAARAIASKCKANLIDLQSLASATAASANPAIPLVKQLTALVAKDDAKAAGFVHWGATSQDANDTGLVLQARRALEILDEDLETLCRGMVQLAEKYRATPMAGRTLMQHAAPTTFGVKVASWLDAMDRHRERLGQAKERVLMLQFGGATGTLAALGEKGLAVAQAMADALGLSLPAMPWHTQRDRIAEIATTLGLVTGSLGKIARDISLHSQTEVAEMFEPASEGRGGSSTMPHKRNPVSCAVILSAATRMPGLVATMLTAVVQEDERGLGNWHAEWETLPEIFRLSGGALHQAAQIVPNLEIDVERMKQNLELTRGQIYSEAVAIALARHVGKQQAHKMLEAASKESQKSGKHLRDVLGADRAVTELLSTPELDRLFATEDHLGSAETFVERVVAQSRARTK